MLARRIRLVSPARLLSASTNENSEPSTCASSDARPPSAAEYLPPRKRPRAHLLSVRFKEYALLRSCLFCAGGLDGCYGERSAARAALAGYEAFSVAEACLPLTWRRRGPGSASTTAPGRTAARGRGAASLRLPTPAQRTTHNTRRTAQVVFMPKAHRRQSLVI